MTQLEQSFVDLLPQLDRDIHINAKVYQYFSNVTLLTAIRKAGFSVVPGQRMGHAVLVISNGAITHTVYAFESVPPNCVITGPDLSTASLVLRCGRAVYFNGPKQTATMPDGSSGLNCSKCKNYFPMAVGNQPDGSLKCYSCRQ